MFENEEYPRIIQFNNGNDELTIYQETVTDVGGVIWDSALMTIHYFFKNPQKFKGKKILELGSGTAVCGIALAALGAEVIITDLPERIPLIKKNVEANRNVTEGRIQIQVLDWTKDTIPSGLDLILAVDCVYYNSTVDPLIHLLVDCDSKEVIVGIELRDIGEASDAQKKFLESIKRFFQFSPISKSELDPDYYADDIVIGMLIRNT
uniref:Protein-lysine methyltransferase METTL21D n=1 Tax=Caenorhabditis tropicalis TaxID=1561998 RepID=A0A1I7TXC1_9PELO